MCLPVSSPSRLPRLGDDRPETAHVGVLIKKNWIPGGTALVLIAPGRLFGFWRLHRVGQRKDVVNVILEDFV